MLMALLDGDALDLVMRTPSANDDGRGFDSLRRIQAAYDAGGECLAPILLQQISSWNAEINASFRRSLEVWDEMRSKCEELSNEKVSDQISL